MRSIDKVLILQSVKMDNYCLIKIPTMDTASFVLMVCFSFEIANSYIYYAILCIVAGWLLDICRYRHCGW